MNTITIEGLASSGGIAFAVFVVSSVLQQAFNFNPKWLALLLALGLSYFVAFSIGNANFEGQMFILATLNGCVAYLSSIGVNATLPGEPTGGGYAAKPDRKWATNWF